MSLAQGSAGREDDGMRKQILLALAVAALVAMPSCGSSHGKWEPDHAAAAKKLEVQVDKSGRHTEVEYHIPPSEVPGPVRQAMDQLHPGGPYEDAEREWDGGKLYYELARRVNGLEVEAMFSPDGKLHSEELQVPMNKVPEAVRTAAMASLSGAQATMWEEIRNSKREVVEYHVKMSRGTDKYKLMLSTSGKLLGMVREVPAEIEVPVDTK
jgi:Putative beta-lactamase-inhibitor-like, PepSY-like